MGEVGRVTWQGEGGGAGLAMWRFRKLEHMTWKSDLMRVWFGTEYSRGTTGGVEWGCSEMAQRVLCYQDCGTKFVPVT